MSKYKHKHTGIIGETSDRDSFLHFQRGDGEVVSLETISMDLIEDSNDWELIEGEHYIKTKKELVENKLVSVGVDSEEDDKKLIEDGVVNEDYLERIPTKWFETEQISTHIGGVDENGDFDFNGHGKLIVMHQCGKNKEVLISQLKTMIDNIKTNGEGFAC
jgi:hypothetical protein